MNNFIKNIVIKNSIIGILILNLVSCSGFLDKNPLDQISGPTFWKTQADADMGLAGVYARLLVSTYDYEQMYWDILGGDLYGASQGSGVTYTKLAQGYIESTSGGPIDAIYSQSYQGITSCNIFLENIDKVSISDDIKNKYKGEVLFLRALFYFTLADFYGGVPLYTKSVTIDEAKVKQSSRADVLKQVQNDLDVAIANLPNTDYSVTGKGHAVKGSALALKAKVCLYQEDWPGAVAAASQVMSDGKFSLSSNFSTMFLTVGQANNPEIMFSSRWLRPDRIQPQTGSQDVQFLWWSLINPRNELVNEFECTDGLPITQSPLYDGSTMLTRKYKSRDPRLVLSVKTFEEPLINSSGKTVYCNPNAPSETGWEPIKTLTIDNLPIDYSTICDQDWVLLRYAEVLLMYAEAKNEVSGPDQTVYKAINDVRARPGINMPPIPSGLTKDQMRTRIMHERRVEFCMEGKRYTDMKRWKLAETYFPTLVDPTGVRHVFDPGKHYVFPFPQSEIDNNKNLVQNPKY